MADVETPKKKSDLPVRFASAVVMLAVAGTALWLGGLWFDLFALIVAVICVSEFGRLVMLAFEGRAARLIALLLGGAYIAIAAYALVDMKERFVLFWVLVVVSVDVGAYFAGRSIGGPKIAPKISPSKTWTGLAGGAIGAAAFFVFYYQIWPAFICPWYYNIVDVYPSGFDHRCDYVPWSFSIWIVVQTLLAGAIIAVVAQSGDFFESWLKRRAGVKDSSNLIPGHGGVFDRVDGLLAVTFPFGVVGFFTA